MIIFDYPLHSKMQVSLPFFRQTPQLMRQDLLEMCQEMLETDHISGTSHVDLLQFGERDTRFLHASRDDGHENDTRSEGCLWVRPQISFNGAVASS